MQISNHYSAQLMSLNLVFTLAELVCSLPTACTTRVSLVSPLLANPLIKIFDTLAVFLLKFLPLEGFSAGPACAILGSVVRVLKPGPV